MALVVGLFVSETLRNECYTSHMSTRKLLVTHHAPDLDAVGSVWMLKRFDAQTFADAKLAFVNPGESLTPDAATELGFEPHDVTHVDTGLGEFDHHQPDRGKQHISATSLTYDHACEVHPDLVSDKALKSIVEFITDIDHFKESDWPDAANPRYMFMLHELLKGGEHSERYSDEHQVQFGMECLDNVYAVFTQYWKAADILEDEAETFRVKDLSCVAVETSNDDVIKFAQKKGYDLVIKKDPKLGNIRIKVRPDAPLTLEKVRDAVLSTDTEGTWYFHPSGKMLINGSQKHRNQTPSPLSLSEVKELVVKAIEAE